MYLYLDVDIKLIIIKRDGKNTHAMNIVKEEKERKIAIKREKEIIDIHFRSLCF
jgi:hypothetical protein